MTSNEIERRNSPYFAFSTEFISFLDNYVILSPSPSLPWSKLHRGLSMIAKLLVISPFLFGSYFAIISTC